MARLGLMVLELPEGVDPDITDLVRASVATFTAEVVLSESGGLLADPSSGVNEDEIRASADALAARLQFPRIGPSESDLQEAIESALDQLREIFGDEND